MDEPVRRTVKLDEMRSGLFFRSGRQIVLTVEDIRPNLNVRIELPDGSDYARGKPCRLEIPGQPPIDSATDAQGELRIFVPNVAVQGATLRLLDAGRELARWNVVIDAQEAA